MSGERARIVRMQHPEEGRCGVCGGHGSPLDYCHDLKALVCVHCLRPLLDAERELVMVAHLERPDAALVQLNP